MRILARKLAVALFVIAIGVAVGAIFSTAHAAADVPAAPGTSQPAPAAPRLDPMRFIVYRHAGSDCEKPCAVWVSAEGAIGPETLGRFRDALRQVGTRNTPLLVSSPGGNIKSALAMGRLIRERRMDVAVSKSRPAPCGSTVSSTCPPTDETGVALGSPLRRGAFCASACGLLLAAGEQRFVGPGVFVGVHQMVIRGFISHVLREFRAVTRLVAGVPRVVDRVPVGIKVLSRTPFERASPPSAYDEVERYFTSMGVGPGLVPLLRATPPSGMHWLTATELRDTRLATAMLDGDDLIAREDARLAAVRRAIADLPATLSPAARAAALRRIEADEGGSERANLLLDVKDGPPARTVEGRVTWSVTPPPPTIGPPGQPALRGRVEISGAKLDATLSLEQNVDPKLAASFLVRLDFASAPGGAVTDVASVGAPELRAVEKAPGVPLTVAISKVGANAFVLCIPSGPDREKNTVDLLETTAWLRLRLVTAAGEDEALMIEMGGSGQRARDEAIERWSRPRHAASS